MKTIKNIKVLVVDDSSLFREMLARGLNDQSGIEVIGVACDANSAFDMVRNLKPDVLTVDVEMPGENGIQFVKRLFRQYPIPVIMVSSLDDVVFEAMSAGAVDFVLKPGMNSMGVQNFFNELVAKIKIAAVSKISAIKKMAMSEMESTCNNDEIIKLIAIGASTGGTEAILKIIMDLPSEMPGIVIVQHIPSAFSKMYAERLNNLCKLHVKEASNGDEVKKGLVLIAPGDKHMTIAKKGEATFVECKQGEKVGGHCPSVNVLFDSVAEAFGADSMGIILTGMGSDGAKGLLNMRKKGAFTIGQDEKSCVVYGMPMEAYKMGAVLKQVPLDNIAKVILKNISDKKNY